MKHNVGNRYSFLEHILEIVETTEHGFGVVRFKLNCNVHGECCTVPNGMQLECLEDELDKMECVKEVDPRYHPSQPPLIDWQKGDVAEVKVGWEMEGKHLKVLGSAVFLEQWWVPIEDPDECDPDFQKEASLKRHKKAEE